MLRVRDVMLARPKTLPVEATVADLRRLFANPRVLTALLVDGPMFVGSIERDDLDAALPDDASARSLASERGDDRRRGDSSRGNGVPRSDRGTAHGATSALTASPWRACCA